MKISNQNNQNSNNRNDGGESLKYVVVLAIILAVIIAGAMGMDASGILEVMPW